MLCRLKPSGSFTIGVGMLVKQKVRWHFSQWKWVCRSLTSHEHDELHTAYFRTVYRVECGFQVGQ